MHSLFDDIAGFIFIEDDPQPADIIFIPGNGHAEPSERAAELYRAGLAPFVLPSGRFAASADAFCSQRSGKKAYKGTFETEWAFMRFVLMENGVPDGAILREDKARFTFQNAIGSRRETQTAGIPVRRALLCCQDVHARRAYCYYQALFPEAELLVCPSGTEPTRKTWMKTPEGITAVLRELEHCGSQLGPLLAEKAFHAYPFPSPLEERYMPDGRLPGEEL